MSIDTQGLDRDVVDDVARRRAPRCYTRAVMADPVSSRVNVENIALAFALAGVSCAAFLILSQGWSL
ncbi:MAG TPA: hypothetical protein VFZ16_03805 [Hyphomicrobiaceae bacterium]|nr:hypothetical protein [Hyphomicrobiaceae bacterium]